MTPRDPGSGPKILLVDDEPLVREELGALLEDEGYQVVTASDGEEGVQLFRRERPDMVVTDVRMPKRDGLSLAITIRHEDPSVPVTVITGHGNESMAIEALRAGVTDFIKKPVRLEDLTAALQRMNAARQPQGLGAAELPGSVVLLESSWSYQLLNDLAAIPTFVDVMLRRCGAGLDRMPLLELSLAIRELLTNAIEHGNLELTFAEKTRALETGSLQQVLRERSARPSLRDRRVRLHARRKGSKIGITIADEGPGFDWRQLPDPSDTTNLLSAHGRGVLLARLSVDALTYNERGNEVTLEKIFS